MITKWYTELNDSSIEQGDLVLSCPIIIPPKEIKADGSYDEVVVKLYNIIVMTQTCDLAHGKVELILVCPYYNYQAFKDQQPIIQNALGKGKDKEDARLFDALRQGHLPGYHLLNKAVEVNINDYLVVDFRNVYGVHINFLKQHISNSGNRHRLLSPYKEHLSQAFARFFMRVGLPSDIPQAKDR